MKIFVLVHCIGAFRYIKDLRVSPATTSLGQNHLPLKKREDLPILTTTSLASKVKLWISWVLRPNSQRKTIHNTWYILATKPVYTIFSHQLLTSTPNEPHTDVWWCPWLCRITDSLLCTLHPGIQWIRLHITGADSTGLRAENSLNKEIKKHSNYIGVQFSSVPCKESRVQ